MPDDVLSLIPESSRRWDDFQGGRPIVLPDGQTWWFYEPEPRVRKGVPGWTFGTDVRPDVDAVLSDRLRRILAKWDRASNDAERTSTILEAAWFLLARNYDVTQDEFEAILMGMDGWEDARQRDMAERLGLLVVDACARSLGSFAEAS